MKVIAIITPKGGAGKTTITAHTISLLNIVKKDIKIGVYDLDYIQGSMMHIRAEDEKRLEVDEKFKEGVENFDIKPCVVEAVDVEDAYEVIEENEDNLDVLFLDMPGTLQNPEILKVLTLVDYIITPTYPDNIGLKTTIDFGNSIVKYLLNSDEAKLKKASIVFNNYEGKYDKMKEENNIFLKGENKITEQGVFNIFKEKIYKRIEIEKSRSTILPLAPKQNTKDTFSFVNFAKELMSFIEF